MISEAPFYNVRNTNLRDPDNTVTSEGRCSNESARNVPLGFPFGSRHTVALIAHGCTRATLLMVSVMALQPPSIDAQ